MTNRQSAAELARLDAAAKGAGLALVCPHQSADELHGALVRDYLATRQGLPKLYLAFASLAVGVGLFALL